jgi:hypothetical protein
MDRLLKVATPELAATAVTPESVPPPGLLARATVTVADEVVVFPKLSWMRTSTAGAMADAAVVVLGWTR